MPTPINCTLSILHGDSTTALQPLTAHARKRAVPLDLNKFTWIDDDWELSDRHDALLTALAAYRAIGLEQPTHAALNHLRSTVTAIARQLLEGAEYEGEPGSAQVVQQAFAGAAAELAEERESFDTGMPAALAHVNHLCDRMQGADLATMLGDLPVLKASLEQYSDDVAHRCNRHADDFMVHERNRAALELPAHDALLQRLAQKNRALWQSDANIYQLLKIKPDYRSTATDAADFEKTFKQGRLVRTNGRYVPPNECLELYKLYASDMQRKQRECHIPTNMPMAELLALRTYTVSSNELNQALRDGDTRTLLEFAPMLKLVISGLNRLPTLRQHKTIYRGMNLTAEQLIESGYIKGNKLFNPAFTSCATNCNTSHTTMEKFNVQLEIEQRDAKLIDPLSLYSGFEDEALFKPMTCFEVVAVHYADPTPDPQRPQVRVKLRQIDPDDMWLSARSSLAHLVRAGFIDPHSPHLARQPDSGG